MKVNETRYPVVDLTLGNNWWLFMKPVRSNFVYFKQWYKGDYTQEATPDSNDYPLQYPRIRGQNPDINDWQIQGWNSYGFVPTGRTKPDKYDNRSGFYIDFTCKGYANMTWNTNLGRCKTELWALQTWADRNAVINLLKLHYASLLQAAGWTIRTIIFTNETAYSNCNITCSGIQTSDNYNGDGCLCNKSINHNDENITPEYLIRRSGGNGSPVKGAVWQWDIQWEIFVVYEKV